MQGLSEKGASGKTVANKHGFLSSALNAAVRAGRISSNPAAGQRLPRSERQEMLCLSHADFAQLLANIPEFWRPLVEFLAASGCRWDGRRPGVKPCALRGPAFREGITPKEEPHTLHWVFRPGRFRY
jgi:hypothetical protein